MKRRFLTFFACFLIVFALAGQEKLHDLLTAAGNADAFPGASHILVYERTSVKMMDSGLSHVTRDVFYKVLNEQGARALKALTFGYDPQSAYIEVKGVKIIRKDGAEVNAPLDGVRDYPAPARMIYWGAREKVLPVDRLEPGDGLWVQTYQKGFTYALLQQDDDARYIPPMKGHFYDIVPFYSEIPILTKTYQVAIPTGKTFQFEFYNGEARHWAHTEGDYTVYFWEKKNITPVPHENIMTDRSDFAPKLLVSTSPDWKVKSLWFHKVNEDFGSFEYNDEIKAKTDEIIRGAKDNWDKISRLTHWVAEEIRYSGISMGTGEGFTLHKGAMTFRDRCGVCKDKAGMLITMLRAAGFESYPAMTMAGSRIDRIPADQFNHCVTLAKVDGKYHLLDPTWVPGVRELWSSAEQQQEYLMGVPEGADLQSTPISAPENHFYRYKVDSRISPEGDLTAQVSLDAEGQSDARVRGNFTRFPIDNWNLMLQYEFSGIHPRAVVSNVRYHDPYDLSKPMRITFDVKIKNYLASGTTGAERLFIPLSSRLPFSGAVFINNINLPEERKNPFKTRGSQLLEIRETVKFPSSFSAALALEPPETVDGGGSSFKGSCKWQGDTMTIEKSLALKKRLYETAEWKSFRKSILEFQKFDKGLLVTVGGKK